MLAMLAVLGFCFCGLGITVVLTLNYNRNGEQIARNVTIETDGEKNLGPYTVPGSGSLTITQDIDVSAVKMIYFTSDLTVTMTTNDDGTPDDTFVITAGAPVVWCVDTGLPNPFKSTVDVTSFKLTKSGAGDA